jgi:hypothetical protein
VWFAAIQCVERKQNLADLAPKRGLVTTDALSVLAATVRSTLIVFYHAASSSGNRVVEKNARRDLDQ